VHEYNMIDRRWNFCDKQDPPIFIERKVLPKHVNTEQFRDNSPSALFTGAATKALVLERHHIK